MLLVCFSFTAQATDYTWTDHSSGDTDWTSQENWNDGASGYPDGNDDSATFDGTWTSSCTVDGAVTVGEITQAAGYSGTVTQGAAVVVDDADAENGYFTTAAGTWATAGYDLSVDGNMDNDATFTHGDGTVYLTGSGNHYNTGFTGSNAFYNLDSAAGNIIIMDDSSIDVQHDLTGNGYIKLYYNAHLTLGSASYSSQVTIATMVVDCRYSNWLYGADSSYPATINPGTLTILQVATSAYIFYLKWIIIVDDFLTPGSQDTYVQLEGDVTFNNINIGAPDELNLNGHKATLNESPVLSGTLTGGTTSEVDLAAGKTWTMDADISLGALGVNGTVTIDPGVTLTFTDTGGFGSSSGTLNAPGTTGLGNDIAVTGTGWDFDTTMLINASYTLFENFTYFNPTKQYSDGCRFDYCEFVGELRTPASNLLEMTYCTFDPTDYSMGSAGGILSTNHNETAAHVALANGVSLSSFTGSLGTGTNVSIYGNFTFDEDLTLGILNGELGTTLTFPSGTTFEAATINCSHAVVRATSWTITDEVIFHNISGAGFASNSNGAFTIEGGSGDYVVMRSVEVSPSNKWHIYSDAIGDYTFLFVNVSNGICEQSTGITVNGINWTGNSGTWDFQAPFWVVNWTYAYPLAGAIIRNLNTFPITASAYDTTNNLAEVLILVKNEYNETVHTFHTTFNATYEYNYAEVLDSSNWTTGFYTIYFYCADDHNPKEGENTKDNGNNGQHKAYEEKEHFNPYRNLTLQMGNARISYRNTTEGAVYNTSSTIEITDDQGVRLQAIFMNAFNEEEDVRTEIRQVDGHYKITWYVTNITGSSVNIMLQGDDVRYLEGSNKAGHFVFGSLLKNVYYIDFQDVIDEGHNITSIVQTKGGYIVTISNASWESGMDVTIDPELGGSNTHMEAITFLFLRDIQNDEPRTEPPRDPEDDGLFLTVLYVVAGSLVAVVIAAAWAKRRGY